jgi:hypothetical protein
VDTGHARKVDGVDFRDIIPNFFAKAIQIFNMRDVSAILADKALLGKVLEAVSDSSSRPLLLESLTSTPMSERSCLPRLSRALCSSWTD